MHVLVINGSPKGDMSVTLQTVKFFQKYFADDEFEIENVGQKIRSLEDETKLLAVADKMRSADLVLFSYPVYTFSVTAQLQRFLELLDKFSQRFDGVVATQISTSMHFFDVTAHKFLEQRLFDLGFSYVKGCSFSMDDLTSYEGRKVAYRFYKFVCHSAQSGLYETDCNVQSADTVQYVQQLDVVPKNTKRTLIITNATSKDVSLNNMIADFERASKTTTDVLNLNDVKFSAGCLGCLGCTASGHCVQKDGFEQLLKERVLTADATVFAMKIVNHSFGSVYKTYTDRQFCNGHRTLTVNMPVGYLISGDYYAEANLQTMVDAAVSVAQNVNVKTVTENSNTSKDILALADGIDYALNNQVSRPQDFYGVGGMKIFRDMIYQMRGIMPLDHKFYKKHGIYDTLPTKHKGKMLAMSFLGLIMKSGKLSSKQLAEGMLMTYGGALKKDEKFD